MFPDISPARLRSPVFQQQLILPECLEANDERGSFLRIAEEHGFDVLVTNDQSIYSQQNLRGRKLAIVVLPTNRRRLIMDRASDVVDTISRIEPGQYVVIELSGARPVIDYNAPEVESSEMPSIQPFKLK